VMVMVSASSIVGWDFGVSVVPAWNSTIFAPWFVVGAVHSGVGLVAIGLYILRKVYRLDDYIKLEHFDKIGKLLVVTTLSLAYLYFAEMLTIWYANIPDHRWVLDAMLTGPFAVAFWFMAICIYILPLATLTNPAFRRWPLGVMIIGVLINIGMYIERVLILVPPLSYPRLPFNWGSYFPSWVELTLIVASLALAVLLFALAVKIVPAIAIWEEKEGLVHGARNET
jgi:Ni/Fe-hydrogenase subunit HybB-like protein